MELILKKLLPRQLFLTIEEKFPDVDVELQFGGQPVYYYIVSVE